MDTATRYRIEFTWREITLYFAGEDWSCNISDARTYTWYEVNMAIDMIGSVMNAFKSATIQARSV